MEALRALDPVAYIRFASVVSLVSRYREFSGRAGSTLVPQPIERVRVALHAPAARRRIARSAVYERARCRRRSLRGGRRTSDALAGRARARSDRASRSRFPPGSKRKCVRAAVWRSVPASRVLNSPGTIDADYRGEVRVVLANFGTEPVVVRRGDRIAQIVVAPVSHARFDAGRRAARRRSAATADSVRRGLRVNVYIVGKGAVGTYLGELLRGVGVDVGLRAARARRGDARSMPTSRSSRRRPTTRTGRSRRCARRSLSRKMRLRLAAKRRRQRGAAGGRVRGRQRRRGGADHPGGSRSRRQRARRQRRWPRAGADRSERL